MSNLLTGQRTVFTPNEKIEKEWILIDAKDQILGRLAAVIAHRLRGKHRADYSPHQDIGDNIVVINAGLIRVSGNKMEQKLYYQHSGYTGGMKVTNLKDKMEKDPIYALRIAVKRMLPKGPLGRKLLTHLKVYPDGEHVHQAQKLQKWEPTFR